LPCSSVVEQVTVNHLVVGSNPTGAAISTITVHAQGRFFHARTTSRPLIKRPKPGSDSIPSFSSCWKLLRNQSRKNALQPNRSSHSPPGSMPTHRFIARLLLGSETTAKRYCSFELYRIRFHSDRRRSLRTTVDSSPQGNRPRPGWSYRFRCLRCEAQHRFLDTPNKRQAIQRNAPPPFKKRKPTFIINGVHKMNLMLLFLDPHFIERLIMK
jgi:hypothetical protein